MCLVRAKILAPTLGSDVYGPKYMILRYDPKKICFPNRARSRGDIRVPFHAFVHAFFMQDDDYLLIQSVNPLCTVHGFSQTESAVTKANTRKTIWGFP